MPIETQEFLSLCREFEKATESEFEQASNSDACSLNPADEIVEFKNLIKPVYTIGSMFAEAAVYSVGQYLPKKWGGQYCKDKLNGPTPVKYDLSMIDGAYAITLTAFASETLAQKLPEKLQSQDALETAKHYNMNSLSKIISAALKPS